MRNICSHEKKYPLIMLALLFIILTGSESVAYAEYFGAIFYGGDGFCYVRSGTPRPSRYTPDVFTSYSISSNSDDIYFFTGYADVFCRFIDGVGCNYANYGMYNPQYPETIYISSCIYTEYRPNMGTSNICIDGTFNKIDRVAAALWNSDGTDIGTGYYDIYRMQQCTDSQTRPCYNGPIGTKGIGICQDGTQTCINGDWETTCQGEVLPQSETCDGLDNDCNGITDDGCECINGQTRSCYEGPGGTRQASVSVKLDIRHASVANGISPAKARFFRIILLPHAMASIINAMAIRTKAAMIAKTTVVKVQKGTQSVFTQAEEV